MRSRSSGSPTTWPSNDWFASGVYLTDEWVESETELFDLLNEAGLAESSEPPRFEVVPAG